MLIRDLQTSDLPAVRGLLRQLGYDVDQAEAGRRIDAVLSVANHHAVVAVLDDTVAGLLHVYERPALEKSREAVVQALVVDERHRGEGIGNALMQAAETWARDCGVEAVVLHTRIDRAEAQAFYGRLGYETVATSNLMCKPLTNS